MEQKKEYIQRLSFLPLRGVVNLKNPDVSIWTAFHYARVRPPDPLVLEGDGIENHELQKVYIGRLLGIGGMREVIFLLYFVKSIPGIKEI